MKNFFIFFIIVLTGCLNNNENKITIDKNDYENQQKEYETLNKNFIILQDKYNRLNETNIEQNKRYQIVKNYNEVIDYEKFLEDYDKRDNKSIKIVEEESNKILMDYYGDGYFIFGLTEIEGYYTKLKRKNYEDKEEEYDAFIITHASLTYLNSIKKLIFSRNTVYEMNLDGDIIATIKINQLSEKVKKVIENSNKKSTIKLLVFIKQPYPSHDRFPPFIEIIDIM